MMQDEKEQNDTTGQEKLENFEHFAKKLFAVPYEEIKEKIQKEEQDPSPPPKENESEENN